MYLTGLGTVTPMATVTVHSRVDGELMSIDFREGQLVKQGEVLAQIDPRPFQVQLTQAEGQLAKDQAALVSAQLDLNRFKDLVSQGLIPQQQVDAQVSLVAQTEASIKTDQGTIDAAKLNITYSRDHVADLGTRRPPSGRPGQHRARRRHHAASSSSRSSIPLPSSSRCPRTASSRCSPSCAPEPRSRSRPGTAT